MEVELGLNASAFVRHVGRLHAQVLGSSGVLGDPTQEPVVALVLAGHLQGDHVVPAEKHHPHLGSFPGQRQGGSDAHQSKASPEVRVVLQTVQNV